MNRPKTDRDPMEARTAGKGIIVPRRIAKGAAVLAILVGVGFAVMLSNTLWRVGLPLPHGMKAVAYLWFATSTVALPISLGVALLRPRRCWSSFAGWWLLAAGVIFLGSLLPVLREYRDLHLSALYSLLLATLCAGGGLLLIRKARRRSSADDPPGPIAEQ